MKKILIIEDDRNIRENICLLLKLNEYDVYELDSGENATQNIRQIMPDIIISDIILPVMDGFQIKQKISEDETINQIPFLFLSAKSDLTDIRQGMNLGADDYLTKPVKAKDLLEAIETRLKRFESLQSDKAVKERHLKPDDRILINAGGKPTLVEIAEIVYISADGEYSTVYLSNNTKYFLRKLLKSWEEELPDKDFIRIHRSSIVNFKYVENINKIDHRNYEVSLMNIDSPLPISQRYAVKIKRKLGV